MKATQTANQAAAAVNPKTQPGHSPKNGTPLRISSSATTANSDLAKGVGTVQSEVQRGVDTGRALAAPALREHVDAEMQEAPEEQPPIRRVEQELVHGLVPMCDKISVGLILSNV